MQESQMCTIEEAVADLKKGKCIIIVDDENRENEGDLMCLAEKITIDIVNFMIRNTTGIICTPCAAKRLDYLRLPLMTIENTTNTQTPFTLPIDAKHTSTGVSAYDRYLTIKALVNKKTKPVDLKRPGHIFPLRPHPNGVLGRAGHTEAALDLCHIAHAYPCGVIAEVMNSDGTMARMPDLLTFAKKNHIKIMSIAQLIEYRKCKDDLVTQGETIDLPSQYGSFKLTAFKDNVTQTVHLAIRKEKSTRAQRAGTKPPLVRIHSSCATGDILGSLRCDCGQQLQKALELIEREGEGTVLYLNQEGRGIGLFNKIKAYKLQEQGYDTVEANEKLGFKADERDYAIAAQMLKKIKQTKIRLLTNNPQKIQALQTYHIEVTERVPLQVPSHRLNKRYLQTKKEKLGHLFSFP